jgi:tripartite-type tricarboxylate transporter receptor subunit TctC
MKAVALFVLVGLFADQPAQAQSLGGKTMTLVTSMGAGGVYDINARLIARHMPKHVPGNPHIIVQNMPGAGNVLATNYMYNIAPKDGTVFAVVNNAIPLHQVLDGRGVRYDVRDFQWLGSPVTGATAVIVMASSGVKSFEDLLKQEVVIGGIGAGSSNVIWPIAMNNVLGTKFKVVSGYNAGPDLWFAMERGETQARTGSYADLATQKPEWLREKKVVFPIQLGIRGDKNLPGVSRIGDLPISEDQRKTLDLIFAPVGYGQPYLAPPGLSAERAQMLKAAFAATLRDEAFLSEARQREIDIDPITAEQLTEAVEMTVNQPPEIVDLAKKAMYVPGVTPD